LIAVYCVTAGFLLLAMLRPAPFIALLQNAGERLWPVGLNLAGFVLTMLPVLFLADGTGTRFMIPSFLSWGIGMALLVGGLLLYLAPPDRWRRLFADAGPALVVTAAAGVFAPYLATLIRPLWQLDGIANFTFTAVVQAISALGYAIEVYPEGKTIGAGDFFISVAPVCSGVEGMALVTVFVSLYLWLFRADLRFPMAFLLYPIGLLTSVLFNILRITLLLKIGLDGNPDLAVGGFHSHAGWLMFTLVSMGMIGLAQTVPALRRAAVTTEVAERPLLPFRADPTVAYIFPFAVFMLSALFVSALANVPGVAYPLRVLAMALALALFLPLYRALPWKVDPVAIGLGLAIGVMWIAIPVAPHEGTPPYGALGGAALVIWFVLRGAGTIIFVPIVEELFFRGYLEKRLRLGSGIAWMIVAAVVTAALFAALHDRWAEAFVASLAFSWAAQRNGRVTDAILSHAVANAVVFGAAVATGNLAII
jgi:exosortase E/protease (VPEID-CTERM system)